MNKIKFLLSMCLLFFLIVSFMAFHAPTLKGDESRMIYYSGLNGLNDTDVNSYGNVSSNLFHKQGNASLLVEVDGTSYFNVANASVELPYVSPPPFSDLTCFGIYAYFSIESACPTIFIAWLNASGGSQVGFREHLEYVEGLGTIMVMSTFYTDAYVGNLYYDLGEYGYTLESLAGAWHWYEIDVYSLDPPLFDFYIDGNNVNMLWGGGINPSDPHTWGMNVNFAMSSYLESSNGNLFYDYLRFYEGEEYPPYLAGARLFQLDISSTPINATFVYTDANSYAFPQSFIVSSGSVQTLTAVSSIRDNATHVHVFDYWDVEYVGLVYSQTVSVEILGDTDLIAHYRDANIPHVEEGWIRIGIGLIGLILMFMSWFIGYWIHKAGDTAKGGLVWFVMFIVGYGLFTVLLGG